MFLLFFEFFSFIKVFYAVYCKVQRNNFIPERRCFYLSLRTKNLPLEKFCPYEVNFLCGNPTEVNRIVSQVLIS